MDKQVIDTHKHTDTGNDNTRRPELALGKNEMKNEINLGVSLQPNKSHTNSWVSEWLNLTAFLGTAYSEVHIVHISRVIIAYTLESLSSLT